MTDDNYYLNYVSSLMEKAFNATPELSKRGIKYDHEDIIKLFDSACLHKVLIEIRDELRFANMEKRMAQFPQSMLNLREREDD